MCNRYGQVNVTHALTADNALGYKLTIFIDGGFARSNTLVLSIVWVNVFDWSENPFTE